MNAAEAAVCESWHNLAPLDGWELHQALGRDLRAAQAERAAALMRHDHDAADAATESMRELTDLLAQSAQGMTDSRARFMERGAWPLLPEPVPDYVTVGDMSQGP